MAAETIKMCNMPIAVAAEVFRMLNPGKVKVDTKSFFGTVLVTDVEPKDLIYPEGWYYAKGNFRNKHQSTTGFYDEMAMVKSDGKTFWGKEATYCTLYD